MWRNTEILLSLLSLQKLAKDRLLKSMPNVPLLTYLATDLSQMKYDAFISYRFGHLDNNLQ